MGTGAGKGSVRALGGMEVVGAERTKRNAVLTPLGGDFLTGFCVLTVQMDP